MKKAISVLLCLCLTLSVFTVVPFAASAAEVTEETVGATSGTTGSCRWSLDDEGNLTISGNGAMVDYDATYSNDTWITTAPWGANIKSVVIEDSVTSIGSYAFYKCTGLTSVTIGNSVTSINKYAFHGCTGLTSVTIPDSVTNIGGSAFYNCTGLTSVIIPDSVTSIGFGSLGYNWGRKKIDGFTIYGVPGSAAEQYANDNGFELIAVSHEKCPNCHAALVIDAAVPPTYTATGLTEGLHCSVCGEVIKTQEILPKKPVDFTYGDLNGDDVVNVTDVTSVQRYLANLKTLTEQELGAADVNTDGKVTIDDVTLLQRYLAEFDVTIG